MLWRQLFWAALAALEGNGVVKDERERLRSAAHKFWPAMDSIESWPLRFVEEADALTNRLLTGGFVDRTIDGMNDVEVLEVSQELHGFCTRMCALPT